MKFLGTIISIKEDGTLALIEFPENLLGLKLPAECSVGFSQSTASNFTIEQCELTKKRLYIRLKQIKTKGRGEQFKEMGVFIAPELLIFDNDEGEFISDLIGCQVIDVDLDRSVGILTEILKMPANDVWIVDTGAGELPLPAIKDVIREIDIDNGKIYIKMIEGLSDLIE
jgi:16S rRNA processing protein RimM